MTPIDLNAVPISASSATNSENAHPQLALAERAGKFGYWRLRLSDAQLTWSPGMYRMAGVDPQDADALPPGWMLERIVDEDAHILHDAINEAVHTRSTFSYRIRVRPPGQAEQIIDTHGEVELGPDDEPVSVMAVSLDVTEKVAGEAALHRAEAMYRAMAEQASDIILLYDPDGYIVHASSALDRTLGRKVDEIDHGRFRALIHPDDLDEVKELTVNPAPGETLTASYRVRHRDGHYVWMETTTRSLFDDDTGTLRNIISVSRDVTERKRRETETETALAEAQAANNAKSAFLANMSHELRTPLNAIIGFADVMQQKMFGPLGTPRYDEYVRLIHESGQLLLDLISDVLDMAKIEAGKMTLHFEEVDLFAVTDDCMHLLRERAVQREVVLVSERPEGRIQIEADRRALKQILLNLLSNAVKFTMPGGTVAVKIAETGGHVQIRVEDNGVGIPAIALPRLGRPFEQVHTDPELAKGGTGLGLALVRALAERHGGSFRIESEEGAGTTISIELPLTQNGAVAAA